MRICRPGPRHGFGSLDTARRYVAELRAIAARGVVGLVAVVLLAAGCATTSCPAGQHPERKWFTIDTGSGIGVPASYTLCRPNGEK